MKKTQKLLRSFAAELVVYAILVTGYFFLVMKFLATWVKEIYDIDRPLYAVIALLLMIGQGALLEFFTTRLLIFVRDKTE